MYTSVWTVHHDARYFKRPYDFIPNRWLDPKSNDVKEASQPFSLGPRSCIGRKYALVMIYDKFFSTFVSFAYIR